jgi:Uma2 family endonuclease
MGEVPEHDRTPRLWTRAEYDQMVEAGILGEDDPVELIDGEILVVSPENALHASVIDTAQLELMNAFGPGFYVRPCHPVAIDDRSEPEPDLAVLRGKPSDFRESHPTTALLLVEVSRTSRAFDRGRKLRLYARNGIPEYWVLDLIEDCLWVHRDPEKEACRTVLREERGSFVKPLSSPRSVGVSDLLGGERA